MTDSRSNGQPSVVGARAVRERFLLIIAVSKKIQLSGGPQWKNFVQLDLRLHYSALPYRG